MSVLTSMVTVSTTARTLMAVITVHVMRTTHLIRMVATVLNILTGVSLYIA